MACRGLILADDGTVIARPFPKFFNLGEMQRGDVTFSKPYKVQEKMDGSLGILYRDPHMGLRLATRGSFTSDQAYYGTNILAKKYPDLKPEEGWTWLFEIIYPANRIVVDYKGMTDLVLLAIVNNETGTEVVLDDSATPILLSQVYGWHGPIVQFHPHVDAEGQRIKPREYLNHYGVNDGSQEGFVFMFDWPKGKRTRVKVKLEEYVKLHKIRTNISTKSIWEWLRDGKDLPALLDELPDDTREWAEQIADDLVKEFVFIKEQIWEQYNQLDKTMSLYGWDRKNPAYRSEFAKRAKSTRWPNEMFMLLEDKNINPGIWRSIQPAYAQPFSDDELVPTS